MLCKNFDCPETVEAWLPQLGCEAEGKKIVKRKVGKYKTIV